MKLKWFAFVTACFVCVSVSFAQNGGKLFSADLPSREWVEFKTAGFTKPVCGVINRIDKSPCCGVPLGGISTGCLDIDPTGTIGFCNIFNGYPREPKLFDPFLGIAVGDKTWVLASEKVVKGGLLESCVEKGREPHYPKRQQNPAFWHKIKLPIQDVSGAIEIHYFGHYPIVDIEYETDCPVNVALRAYSPFLPGQIQISDTPAAVFEVILRNTSTKSQKGTLAFNFNAPLQDVKRQNYFKPQNEVGPPPIFKRSMIKEKATGTIVRYEDAAYALAVLNESDNVRSGGALDYKTWSKIDTILPKVQESQAGSCLAVGFDLKPGEIRTVKYLLAWFVPTWGETGTKWHRMNAQVYPSAEDVIDFMAANHESILKKIINWQQVVYDSKYPLWLKDTLVNCLALITEDGYYAQPKSPLGDWCPDGLFGMIECPRACPQISCIPCDWYGNMPIVYFFPKLAHSTLKGYKQYQRKEDGAAPFMFGAHTDMNRAYNQQPYENQIMLNGVCYVDMVYRMWQRSGDKKLLAEFYDSVKASTTLTATMGEEPYPVVGFPPGDKQTEWWEGWPWTGIATHAAGMHLSNIMLAESMAKAMGDEVFAKQCRSWFKKGSETLESNNWLDGSYLLFNKPQTGKKSDNVMSNQLDADWANAYLGLKEGVFKPDRALATLETIERTCFNEMVGAVSFASRDGSQELTTYGIFPPETLILGMTYMYKDDKETGIKVSYDCMYNMVIRQGKGWDMTNMVNADTGEVRFGTDYYQMMILWAVPVAIDGQSLKEFCAPGGFVDKIMKAAQ